jgi:hypothetical protein
MDGVMEFRRANKPVMGTSRFVFIVVIEYRAPPATAGRRVLDTDRQAVVLVTHFWFTGFIWRAGWRADNMGTSLDSHFLHYPPNASKNRPASGVFEVWEQRASATDSSRPGGVCSAG